MPPPDPRLKPAPALGKSSEAYDEVYKKTKMPDQEPEIHTEPLGDRKTREERLREEQGDKLRIKHLPQRLHSLHKRNELKDHEKTKVVGFEYNFKEAGRPLPPPGKLGALRGFLRILISCFYYISAKFQ